MKGSNINSKAKKSVTIVSVGYFLSKVIDIIKNIVLARLLLPEDFGVVALALVLTEFFRQIARSEFNSALIKDRHMKESVLYTGYTFSMLSTAIIIVIAFASANLYASYYDTESLSSVVRVLSLSFALFAFGFIPETLCSKELEFGKIVLAEVTAVFLSLLTAVVLAIMDFGYWSIVWGVFAKFAFYQIGLFLLRPVKLRLVFDFESAKKLFRFGSRVLLTTILVFIGSKIPDAIIGKILGLTALGYFSLAFRWGTIVSYDLMNILKRVLFPAFSDMQENLDRIRSAYITTLRYLSLIIFPSCFGIAAVAPEFIRVIFGDKWIPAVASLQILAFSGIWQCIRIVGGEARKAIGRPEITNYAVMIQIVVLVSLLIPLAFWNGLTGASWAIFSAAMLITLSLIVVDGKLFHFKIASIMNAVKHPLFGSIIMVFSIYITRIPLKTLSDTAVLFILIAVGFIIYTVYTLTVNYTFLSRLKSLKENNLTHVSIHSN